MGGEGVDNVMVQISPAQTRRHVTQAEVCCTSLDLQQLLKQFTGNRKLWFQALGCHLSDTVTGHIGSINICKITGCKNKHTL